jgi:glycosyltransferase involved in cell wall biosynthesis
MAYVSFMMPGISVIIPAYNHARFLPQAIESVLAQTLLPAELIVVDDGSTDDTPQVLARYSECVRYIRQQNRGVSAARNTGAAVAMGDYLAFLDADDEWLPHKLEMQMARFTNEPELGLVHCGVVEINGEGALLSVRQDGLEGWLIEEFLLFRRAIILGAGSSALIPRRILFELGGWDEQLSTAADWDVCCRIAARYPIGFVSEELLRYRIHGTNMHTNFNAMEHDMLLAFEKAYQAATPEQHRLRRRGYGNLHTVLAGAFFSAGQYRKFLPHAIKSLFLTPDNITRYLEYPRRWWQRRMAATSATPQTSEVSK